MDGNVVMQGEVLRADSGARAAASAGAAEAAPWEAKARAAGECEASGVSKAGVAGSTEAADACRAGASRVGLLVACYGTSCAARAQASVAELAQAVHEALCRARGLTADELPCCVAFTSAKVRRKLAMAGAPVPSVDEAFCRLRAAGACEVIVASSHLVDGTAYAEVRAAAEEAAAAGTRVRLAEPLLADAGDVRDLADALAERYPTEAGRTVVLVGHGAAGAGQFAYAALAQSLLMAGRSDMLVGTLCGRPGVDDVLHALASMTARCVTLVPLMLTAGAHAARDLAGEGPESWASRLRAVGYAVEVVDEALAALPVVRGLMVRHMLAAAEVPIRSGADKPRLRASGRTETLSAGVPVNADASASVPAERVAGHRESARFPLFVDLTGADCLVVGAGAVGSRRASALACFGARVTVIDPRGWTDAAAQGAADAVPGAGLETDDTVPAERDTRSVTGALAAAGSAVPEAVGAGAGPALGIAVQQRAYAPGDERERFLVVAATSDRVVNRAIGARCRAAGIPVSVADAADECTFVFPALATAPGLVCGIVSTNNDHAHVARAARAVRSALVTECPQAGTSLQEPARRQTDVPPLAGVSAQTDKGPCATAP